MPRFALLGHLERLADEEVRAQNVSGCFFARHGEARLWAPGNDIHESWWARLVVDEVYWIGGFGDRAYIGWIPRDVWQGVTMEEVESCRLVGEKGYQDGNEEDYQNGEEDHRNGRKERYQTTDENDDQLKGIQSIEQELR